MMNLIESLRKRTIDQLFKVESFEKHWERWQVEIENKLGDEITAEKLIDLGDHLSEIFQTTTEPGRSQDTLSGGGTAWECLITWYINMCSIGSRVVAFKKMSEVPEPVRRAITVNYVNFKCNTESDITVIVFPDRDEYTRPINDIELTDSKGRFKISNSKGLTNKKRALDFLSNRDYESYEVGIVQCKTNWNDNSQIPMMWSMIYNANSFRDPNISLGDASYSLDRINRFSYSFVTVPSNKNEFKSDSVAVRRVILG
ncbi:hypothetical protein V6R21_05760 [Limibacter armeniacum]|uniref:hypothetical protein n=1 Tax=Limibacter armeniacum TaxID=466084 RepID=UPI002FE5858F